VLGVLENKDFDFENSNTYSTSADSDEGCGSVVSVWRDVSASCRPQPWWRSPCLATSSTARACGERRCWGLRSAGRWWRDHDSWCLLDSDEYWSSSQPLELSDALLHNTHVKPSPRLIRPGSPAADGWWRYKHKLHVDILNDSQSLWTTECDITILNKRRAVAAQTARSRCKVLPYSTLRPIILRLTKGKRLYMASESLLSCISPFLQHLRNQWPWISLRGYLRSSIFVSIESAYTYSY